MDHLRKTYTTTEAAALLRISEGAVRMRITRGVLRSTMRGRDHDISEVDLMDQKIKGMEGMTLGEWLRKRNPR